MFLIESSSYELRSIISTIIFYSIQIYRFLHRSKGFQGPTHSTLQEGICKPGGCLTSFHLLFPYNMPCFCRSRFLSLNIPPSRFLAWLKAFPQSHLMSKTSYNNTTKMAQLRMPFSLSRQYYQVSPPLRIHCAPYSNCMCHAGDSAYQGLNDLFWNFNSHHTSNNTTTTNMTTMYQSPNWSLIYIFKLLFIFFLLIIVIILFHLFYVFISWFIHRVDFNNYPVVVICRCRCCFLSFCAASDLQNNIVPSLP